MKKKAMHGQTWIIIGVVVVLLAVLGVAGSTIARGGADSEESLLELGQRYLDELDYEQAVVCFEEYLEIDPKSVEAYAGLAKAYVGLAEYEKALEVLAEGYVVTGDGSLWELSSRIEEQYRKQLLAEGEIKDIDVTDESPENTTEGLMEPLVLDRTKTSVIAGNGGIIITLENELYGAINYQGKEIVPHIYPYYMHIPTEEGYFALGDETGTYIFNSRGEIVYEILDKYGYLYVSEGIALYTVGGEVYWYDLATKVKSSVDLTPGVSITQMQDGEFNAWRYYLNESLEPEDIDKAFWTVNQNGFVKKDEDAVWGFECFDWSVIYAKADGYIPMSLWGGFGLLDESGATVIWSNWWELDEMNIDTEIVALKGYYRDGLWLYNRGTQVVVTERSGSPCALLDLSYAVAAPAVLEGTESFFTGSSSVASSWSNEPAGRVTNMEDVLLAYYDYIQLSDSGYYLAGDGESWFYLDETGKKIDQAFLDCGAFYNGYAIILDADGMAYLIDTEFNKVSDGYPADGVSTAEAVFCARMGDQVTILIAPDNNIR